MRKSKRAKSRPAIALNVMDDVEFHDGSLIEVSISSTLDRIKFVTYAPYDNGEGAEGNFFSIVMEGILKFTFSTVWDGSAYAHPIDVYEIKLINDEEKLEYEERVKSILKEFKGENSKQVAQAEVFKIVFFSSTHRSFKDEEDQGISVICRHIVIENLGSSYSAVKYKPEAIPSD